MKCKKESTAQKAYLRRQLHRRRLVLFCRIFLFVFFLICWEMSARLGLIDAFIFSSPSRTVRCFLRMMQDKSILIHTGVTLYETLISFTLVILCGLIGAVLLWSSRNLRLVAHVVKKYQGLPDDLDDLISIGTIGLIKAVMTYDSKKGNRLAAYAARCIDNELLMYLRSKKKTAREISLYEPIGTDKEGNEIHLLDIVEGGGEDIAEQYNRKEDAVRLYCYLDSELKEQEKQVLLLRYGLGGKAEYTQKQVAARLGISRSYVSRIEKNAIEKLRLRFAAS